jgi:hypothetical protein
MPSPLKLPQGPAAPSCTDDATETMTLLSDHRLSAEPPSDVLTLLPQDPDLDRRYDEYCRRQAAALVSILPREAVRPLYARAREWGRASGLQTEKDPLATLLLFLQQVLPLPPREVWMHDRVANLEAHLREEFESPQAGRCPPPPLTVEARWMEAKGRRWRASLHLFHRGEAWRGFITFHSMEGGEGFRTADIFREEDPEEIRARFLGYQDHTLQAFLRSVFPG